MTVANNRNVMIVKKIFSAYTEGTIVWVKKMTLSYLPSCNFFWFLFAVVNMICSMFWIFDSVMVLVCKSFSYTEDK
ncbi:hypothetical protein V1478_014970 [Vespula squamosa]|uniref:Uncharacterized protein n=1 Tax=Vespula squamosa TaxID=30214 RepID=A0ABD2A467_VESSQ